jgi:hypothetical protein
MVSDDGQVVQFHFLNRTGANLLFTVSFSEIGVLLKSIQHSAKKMSDRLVANGKAAEDQVAQGLANATTVSAVALGKDSDTGDALLWVETADQGPMSFRMSEDMIEELRLGLVEHQARSRAGAG